MILVSCYGNFKIDQKMFQTKILLFNTIYDDLALSYFLVRF